MKVGDLVLRANEVSRAEPQRKHAEPQWKVGSNRSTPKRKL